MPSTARLHRNHADAPRYHFAKGLTTLQTLRLARNLTQKEIASRVGTSESVVCLWETFSREPSGRLRGTYARVIGLTVGQLGRIVYEGRTKKSKPRARGVK